MGPRPTRWWHGGAPGLRPGDRILPASRLSDVAALGYALEGYPADPSTVYITSDKTLARAYAGKWTDGTRRIGGDLYNVRPRGQLNPDPDYIDDPACQTCTSAVVVAVAERRITMTLELEIYSNRRTTWDDGSPMYDRQGYPQPNLAMREAGLTAEHLRALGVLAPYTRIKQAAGLWLNQN